MNKNLLIKQNNELFTRIQLLKKQNLALSAQIKQLNSEAIAHTKEIEELKSELASLKNSASNSVHTEEASLSDEALVEEVKTEVIDEVEEIVLPEDFTYASDIIGNIVIKAAGFINELTANDNPNKKELINLILGRTEIAKAEILNVVSSEVSFDAKKELIDTQFNEALEYFKSIIEQ